MGAGVTFLLLMGVAATAAGWTFAPRLLRLLATPPAAPAEELLQSDSKPMARQYPAG